MTIDIQYYDWLIINCVIIILLSINMFGIIFDFFKGKK